ncbi:hypothetical protein AVEN_222637-1 [Araneus ventricosus]|uniref:Transposase Tc1-like domain-containing protein n=1 Tax=Araneus ventricosus TaxID=182803 RepID=A0A4Y2MQM6_ARAVE|nr:hypothetical protein AVEN_156491-1 [Araneus ventricosus]GBN27916.1 hypothetical protein AVEN_222637-1 [Araneus ventricosus]
MGFVSRRPTRVPLLNARHRAARLAWAREHREWSLEDWKRIAWSDESRFRLLHADGRLRICRQGHEAIDPACQVGIVQGHGGSIMVWVVFSWQFWRSLVLVPASLKAILYVELLGNHLHPFILTVIHMEMGYSSKTTAPLTGHGWLLPCWMSIPLTSLS